MSFFTTFLDNLVCWIETAAIDVVNGVVVGLAAFVTTIVALLPNMPSLPSMPSQITSAYQYVAYWFPLDWFVADLLTLFTLWLLWIPLAAALRWGKAIRGNQ